MVSLGLVSRLLDDSYLAGTEAHHQWKRKLLNWAGHKIDGQLEYSLKHKFYNEKGLTAVSLSLSVPIMVVSAVGAGAITAGTKGIATPLALGALAAGAWAANQVADAVTELVRNQYRQVRMHHWLQDYPDARQEIENKGEKLLLMEDSCDSIRRAVDHFRKTGRAANEVAKTIQTTHMGQYTNCSEVVKMAKQQMKFIHELQKTERYLVPALDLAILLRNTQSALCKKWRGMQNSYTNALGNFFLTGDHSSCNFCYAPEGRSPLPRKGLNGGGAMARIGVLHYGDRAEALDDEVKRLVQMREVFGTDLRLTVRPPRDIDGMARQRYAALLVDAARHYDKPDFAKRTRHYVSNYISRTTRGEKFLQVFNRSSALALGVGTASVGSVFNTGVVVPHIVAPLQDAIKIPHGLVSGLQLSSLNSLVDGAVDKVGAKVASFTGSAVKTSVNLTAKGVVEGAKLGTKIVTGLVESEPDELSGERIKKTGKHIGDSMFKKVARHLQQAADALQTIEGTSYRLSGCEGAMAFGADVGEFIWHLDKSIRYLDHCMKLVDHMARGVEAWSAMEGELWVSVEATSMQFLSRGCKNCACHDKTLGLSFSACYGPGVQASAPKRRM